MANNNNWQLQVLNKVLAEEEANARLKRRDPAAYEAKMLAQLPTSKCCLCGETFSWSKRKRPLAVRISTTNSIAAIELGSKRKRPLAVRISTTNSITAIELTRFGVKPPWSNLER